MNGYVVLLKRELLSISREKTIILAIMVQLLIASLSSVILQGIMAFYDPTSIGWGTGVSIRAGFVGEADSPLPTYLNSKGIIVKPFSIKVSGFDADIEGENTMDGIVRYLVKIELVPLTKIKIPFHVTGNYDNPKVTLGKGHTLPE